jgi:aminoglycoside phosphotransferase (APT) family kinase protein
LIAKLQPIVAHLFPAETAVHITDLQRLEGGLENEVYTVKLRIEASNAIQQQKMILRLFPAADGAEKANREQSILSHLHQGGYPVPVIFHADSDKDVLGKPFTLTEFIEGIPLQLKLAEEVEESQAVLLTKFCRLFVRLHRLEASSIIPTLSLNQIIEQITVWLPGDFAASFSPALDWLHAQAQQIDVWETAVTHNDFTPANVLVQPDGRMVVIDWAGAAATDPRVDLAWTLFTLSLSGWGVWETAVREQYSQFSGRPVTQLDFFTALAYIRFLTYMAQLAAIPEAENGGAAAPFFQAIIQSTLERFSATSGLDLTALKQQLGCPTT